MTNYTQARRWAKERTLGTVSQGLLESFPQLVALSDEDEPSYRDIDFTGPVMATWREASILHAIVRAVKPKQALEIGTSVGWTAAHIADALPKGAQLMCVDPFIETASGLGRMDSGVRVRLEENMERAGLASRYLLSMRESPAILPSLAPEGGWDFVFLDGWHRDGQPVRDIEGVVPHLNAKSVIVLHDIGPHAIEDVNEAGRFLARLGWYFTGYLTRNGIAIFVQHVFQEGKPHTFPKWWDKLQEDIDLLFKEE